MKGIVFCKFKYVINFGNRLKVAMSRFERTPLPILRVSEFEKNQGSNCVGFSPFVDSIPGSLGCKQGHSLLGWRLTTKLNYLC